MAGQLDLPEESSSKREPFQAPKAPAVQQFQLEEIHIDPKRRFQENMNSLKQCVASFID